MCGSNYKSHYNCQTTPKCYHDVPDSYRTLFLWYRTRIGFCFFKLVGYVLNPEELLFGYVIIFPLGNWDSKKEKTLEIYEFAKACPHWLNDSSTGQKSPGQEIGLSSMYATWTTPAGCHVNTEPSNKVQQFSKTPKKTVNNKVIQHWKLKVQLAGSVNEQNTLPSPRF